MFLQSARNVSRLVSGLYRFAKNCFECQKSMGCLPVLCSRIPINTVMQRRYYRKELSCPPITETSPDLLLYWHPTKNQGVLPSEVTIKSFRKVWWKCPKGVDHEWQNSVRYVVDKNGKYTGCPFCNNKRVSITNSLSTKYPELASQWHPTRNGSLLPSGVTYTSSKNVWWQCDKDPSHVWKRPVSQRVNPKTTTQDLCPYCCGMTLDTRNLESLYPEIAREWNYEKNGGLLPSQVSKSSAVRVWWKCENGHEWQTSVNNRTSSHRSKCPICSGRKISYERSLAYLFPEVASQWHPTKNHPLTPESAFPFSDRLVWWVCSGLPQSIGEVEYVDLLGYGLKRKEGCGTEWQESIVGRGENSVFKNNCCYCYCYGGGDCNPNLSCYSIACPECSRDARKRVNKPSNTHTPKTARSKRLKKLRVLGGKHSDEIIMVSSSDYEMLLATGAYEPVKDLSASEKTNDSGGSNNDISSGNESGNEYNESERLMKEVYGKQKSPYRKLTATARSNTEGPRSRTVVVSMTKPASPHENDMSLMNIHSSRAVDNADNTNNSGNSGNSGNIVKGEEELGQAVRKNEEMVLGESGDGLSVRGLDFANEDPMYYDENLLFEDGFEEEDLSQYLQTRSDQQRTDSLHKSEDGEEGWSFS